MNGGAQDNRPSGTGVNLRALRPMDAVAALYSEADADVADALLARLSHAIFDQPEPAPARPLQQMLSELTHRIVKRTTTRHETEGGEHYRNRLLERSRHPYARALLASSSAETQSLVEGGDPMNGPYMMLVPEIRETATLWDKLFFSSVQAKDVKLRFVWETKATCEQAGKRLDGTRVPHLKALAGGTGLSMILTYDRLVREGAKVTCEITDRDPANTAKTNRLLAKLAARRGWTTGTAGISAHTEDIFAEIGGGRPCDVVTAVGILEYLQGFTCDTTEQRHGLPESEDAMTALHLAEKFAAMTVPDGCVIVNTHRPHHCTRLLELFGKKFDYRSSNELDGMLATQGFRPAGTMGAAVVYDVSIYEKAPAG